MEKYDYREVICEDIRYYLRENDIHVNEFNRESIEEDLRDELFCEDCVTGNASGSYTFSTWQAEENLCHNMDLLEEACYEFGCQPKLDSAEWCDVTIRCYLLSECLSKVLDELEEEEYEEDEEEEL